MDENVKCGNSLKLNWSELFFGNKKTPLTEKTISEAEKSISLNLSEEKETYRQKNETHQVLNTSNYRSNTTDPVVIDANGGVSHQAG